MSWPVSLSMSPLLKQMDQDKSRHLKLDAHILAYIGGYTKHFLKATETMCKKECIGLSCGGKVKQIPSNTDAIPIFK